MTAHKKQTVGVRGFTLIELLIVIAVILILLAISITGFYNYSMQTGRDAVAHTVLGAFEEAHARTLASDSGSQYGVHVDTSSITIFQGATYTVGSASNEVRELPARTAVTNIALTGGASEVLFSRLTGATSATGTITVAQTINPTHTRTITVYDSGLVEVSQ